MNLTRRSRTFVLAALIGVGLALSSCANEQPSRTFQVPDADPDAGRILFQNYGCASCHAAPDVPSVRNGVGPSLTNLPDRLYLAGQVPNRPEELIRWIQHPQQVNPGTLMPDLGVSEQDARDIAAYLYAP